MDVIDNKSIFSKVYVPAPAKPPFFDEDVTTIGGKNPHGGAMLRIVWGMDVRAFRNNNPQAIKYPGYWGIGIDRWILEAWRPPTFFGTQDQWEQARYTVDGTGKKVDLNGEYPARGFYGMVEPLYHRDTGEYVPCSEQVLIYLRFNHAEFMNNPPNCYSSAVRYAKLQADMQREQEEGWARADNEADKMAEYVNTRAEKLNAAPTRAYGLPPLIVQPNGKPFERTQ